ncbi:chalcone isomerase family protein [Psychromonas sp. KJ10-10]|uniref:chalcone isomerase family protein n=1 Tax=Psychromonas sp. KJ10-10 TaxID=3391823 RepID=UPI0039B3C855
MKKTKCIHPLHRSFVAESLFNRKQVNYFTSFIAIFFILISHHTVNATSLPQQLIKVGEGTMSWMFLDIYHASLFTSTGKYNEQSHPQVLTINYLKNIKKNSLIEATEEQWLLHDVDEEKLKNWLQLLHQIWPDINKGDSLTFHVAENKEGYFYYNQELIGRIPNEDFCNAFLAIWLSEKTSQPKLRRQLLAL